MMQKTLAIVGTLLLIMIFTAGASPAAKPFDEEAVAKEIARIAGWDAEGAMAGTAPAGKSGCGWITNWDRTVLYDDIAHYTFDIRFGSGEYDVIRIHRVVKERRPYRPIRTSKNIFLLHGDGVGFVKFVFGSETPYLPDEHSVATFLALEDVDVWGMDQPWAIVPGGLADYSFAADWGMQYNVDALRRGLAISRFARIVTGNGWGKMNVLGYSSGGTTVYALMNEESQRPTWAKLVNGFVIADINYKYDTSDPEMETSRQNVCDYADYVQSLIDDGYYDIGFGAFFEAVGFLAETAPDDPSPIYPGFTNMEAALYMGAVPDPLGFNPWFHYVAGIYGEDPVVPEDLRFTSIGAWLDFIQTASPFEPTLFVLEYSKILCDEADLPFDDHLDEVTEPVLYLGPAGGIGTTGEYTLDILGSTDVTSVIISLYPPYEFDFGHIDMWTAEDADVYVYTPLLDWIEDHDPLLAPPAGEESALAASRPRFDDVPLRVTPNPGRTSHYTFAFEMASGGRASLQVYDVAGRQVAGPIVSHAPAGRNQLIWNAASPDGRRIGQGVYFARISTPEGVQTAKFVHLGP